MTATEPMPNPQSVGWTVNSQRESTKVMGGVVVQGVEIEFTTGRGTSGTVFVPNNQYNVDSARQAIGARASMIDAIDQLTSAG